jgi:hypothetical protein
VDWGDFSSGLLGAVAGLIFGNLTELWKADRDDVIDLLHGFCDLVAEAADNGAKFRLTSPGSPEVDLLAIKLTGYQNRISGYRTILIGRIDDDAMDGIESSLANFFKTLTGGDADLPDRKISHADAIKVHEAAAAAIVEIRRAEFSVTSMKERFSRFVSRNYPNA